MNTDKLNAYCTSYNSTMYTFLSAYIYPFNCAGTAPRVPVRIMVFCCLRWLGKTLKLIARRRRRRRRERYITTHHQPIQHRLWARCTSLTGVRPCPFVRTRMYVCRPQIMCDYPLNLSILIRGGKETNKDSASSCERKRKSSARRGDATVRCLPGSVYWKFCHPPCPAQCPSSTRMWLLLPQRVIGP